MPILIFKTNIESKHDFSRLEAALAANAQVQSWHIDTEDIDKVLRIESAIDNSGEIIHLVKQAGYSCEELTD